MSASGLIFDIQKYCIHDGPGIRTTVFFKGCPLSCWWCHNPESQDLTPETRWLPSRCCNCEECYAVCPQHAIGTGPDKHSQSACICCGKCVATCPTAARQMVGRRMTVPEVMQEVLRDRIFYDDAQGGATFSGGEPLLQPDFLKALLQACRAEDIHTAVDTCGFASWDVFQAILPFTDLFLFDLKTVDNLAHRRHTGVSNQVILDNLHRLGQSHRNIWVRIPLVPGLNDDPQQVEAAARLAATLPGVRQVNILPYHHLGAHKRAGSPVARTVCPPSGEIIEEFADYFRAHGLPTYIGG